jgi:class 3 adenylate cyclase
VSATKELDMTFRETKLVLLSADLAGYARATAHLDALAVAAFLDDWYRQCATAIRGHGGQLVKYIGDGCLATFPDDKCGDAIDTATELERSIDVLKAKHRLKVDVGANVHLAVVAEGKFGPDDDPRYDVLGSGVNHLFLMGGGAGIRVSEPVYRQLPNHRRGDWRKNRPPATYTWSPPR